jgi:hypothetical protein
MLVRLKLLCLFAMVLATGCASGPPFIDQAEPEAMAIAQRRAAFEFNCPTVTVQLLSRETLQPVSFQFGIQRAEYTIGVTGCGKRATYVVVCPDQQASICFAGAGRDGILP